MKTRICRLTDNGSPYKNGQLKFILGNLGITEKHTRIRDGAGKGNVEHNFRTLRSRWLATLDISRIHSLEQFNSLLQDYIKTHNKTYHSGINGCPVDRYAKTKNYIRIPRSREWLEECFYNRITRKVRSDSVVRINSTEYDVPAQFCGMSVEIRFNPLRIEDAFLIYNGRRYPVKKTDRVENGSPRRNSTILAIDYHAREEES